MTQLLEEVMQELRDLEPIEQDRIAKWLRAELRSETRWNNAFEESRNELDLLAMQALADFDAGATELLEIEE